MSSESPLWLALCAGSFGGLCNVVSGHPLDTVKVRIQTGHTKGLFQGLFRGIWAPVSSVVPFWAIIYFGYKAGRQMQPDDSLSSIVRAGAVAGCCGSVVWVPMQAVKCVAQDQRCSSLAALRHIRERAGYRGLYRGFAPTLLLFSLPGACAFYGTYELSGSALGSAWWVPFVAGGAAGIAEWTVGMPGDTIRTRYQTGLGYKNLHACVSELLATHGCRGLYRGYSAAFVRAFLSNGAALVGIEAVYSAHAALRPTAAPRALAATDRVSRPAQAEPPSVAELSQAVAPPLACANV